MKTTLNLYFKMFMNRQNGKIFLHGINRNLEQSLQAENMFKAAKKQNKKHHCGTYRFCASLGTWKKLPPQTFFLREARARATQMLFTF